MKARNSKDAKQSGLISVALALLTLAVYLPTMGNDFVNYDDGDYVTGNEHVQSGINRESVAWAFTTGHASNWHPLTWISHELDCQIYGTKARGPHLTNLLFHIANTVLLFLVLRKMTGTLWRSAFVAAMFALHPTHVESVAWISERKDVLSTCFWMLTMFAYAKYAEAFKNKSEKRKMYYGLALVFFALGLMSKPMLVTLPFVLLLLDFWPLGRICDLRFTIHESEDEDAAKFQCVSWLKAVVEKIPFLTLAAASSVATFVAQKKGGAVATLAAVPAAKRFANALVSYLRYVGKSIWPSDLSVLYPTPASWPIILVITAAAFVVMASVLAVMQAKRRPYLFVGWFWFVGTLVPVIGLVQVGLQSMADRYLYVPAVGLFIAVAWGATELASGLAKKRELLSTVATVSLAVCGLLTFRQVRYWKNGETLFRRAVAVTRDNYLAYNNLGFYLEDHGKADEALEDYQKSVEINPRYEDARNNLGHLLTVQGKYEAAIVHLQEALKIKPDLVEARNNLGNALGDLGRFDEAIKQYELALHYNPKDGDANNNLGVERARQGRLVEAEKLLREAVRVKPADAGAHSNLGNVLALQHEPAEAVQEYKRALQLSPNDSQTHFNLGNVLLEQNNLAAAAEQYGAAIKTKPDNADAHYRLGLILGAQGKRDEALIHLHEAVRLNPNNADAQRRVEALLKNK